MKDVSWKRVVVAAAATFLSLYALQFARADMVYSEMPGSASLLWLYALTFVSNAVWWGVLLFPRKAKAASYTGTPR